MAESDKVNSLSQDYLLKDSEEKVNVSTEPEDKSADKDTVEGPPTPPVTEPPVETPVVPVVNESVPESVNTAAEENVATTETSDNDVTEPPPAANEEASENTPDETPEIKLETAPGDYRFPTTNQSRHCFTRYVEYHRCVAAKGEDDASECDKFAKYYRSLCPGEWIDRWNEQRENGTFPGPL
ncbi:putative cytochrome-c oxidase [Helianthus annuus]|nr:putative cytochrome-c oxidase [Helianthus annuus]KAJ0882062.1 putative cytochrome-c oxidase [Helianthus annuus]